MNNQYVRVTYTVPKYIADKLELIEKGEKSKFVTEAIEKKLEENESYKFNNKDSLKRIFEIRKAIKTKYSTEKIIDFINEDQL